MDRLDYQQQEADRERMMLATEALDRIAAAGFIEEAVVLARECGIDLDDKWTLNQDR